MAEVIVGTHENSDLAKDLKEKYPDVNFVFDPKGHGLISVKTYDKHTDDCARWHGIGRYNHPG
jgi:hypothetical protein